MCSGLCSARPLEPACEHQSSEKVKQKNGTETTEIRDRKSLKVSADTTATSRTTGMAVTSWDAYKPSPCRKSQHQIRSCKTQPLRATVTPERCSTSRETIQGKSFAHLLIKVGFFNFEPFLLSLVFTTKTLHCSSILYKCCILVNQ